MLINPRKCSILTIFPMLINPRNRPPKKTEGGGGWGVKKVTKSAQVGKMWGPDGKTLVNFVIMFFRFGAVLTVLWSGGSKNGQKIDPKKILRN
jgi:hypothetical protein